MTVRAHIPHNKIAADVLPSAVGALVGDDVIMVTMQSNPCLCTLPIELTKALLLLCRQLHLQPGEAVLHQGDAPNLRRS
jgi:hypothetical protein